MNLTSANKQQKPSLAFLRELVRSNPQLLKPKLTKYFLQQPTPKQLAFLLLPQLEAFFGGAGGGGKSSAGLMAALQYVDVPGYRALILRRTFQDLRLPGALMDRAEEWLRGTDITWNASDKTYTFPSGATLTFGYLESENDKYRYQGAEFQFIFFDELSQFTETQYQYLFSRLRKIKNVPIPIRMRSASNPGGTGHEWVKQRFITSKEPDRIFIPASLTDNPYIDEVEYTKSLDQLDFITRQQLLYGDWDVLIDGTLFKRDWIKPVNELPDPKEIERIVRAWDLAATEEKKGNDPDYTAGILVAKLRNGRYTILDLIHFRGDPKTLDDILLKTAISDRKKYSYIDWVIEEEGGSSGKIAMNHMTRLLAGYTVKGVRSTGSKRDRAKPVSSMAGNGNIDMLESEWNLKFLRELVAFPQPNIHDDIVDSLSLAFSELTKTGWGFY